MSVTNKQLENLSVAEAEQLVNGREIKFKAWHKKLKVMSYPIEMFNHFPFEIDLKFPSDDLPRGDLIIHAGDVIWLQFTGLRDKNRREVYEGDILRDWLGNLIVMTFSPQHGYPASFAHPEEIVGNIYENPEFLK